MEHSTRIRSTGGAMTVDSSDDESLSIYPHPSFGRRKQKRPLPIHLSSDDENLQEELEARMVRPRDLDGRFVPRNHSGFLDDNNNLTAYDAEGQYALGGIYDRYFTDEQPHYHVRWMNYERSEDHWVALDDLTGSILVVLKFEENIEREFQRLKLNRKNRRRGRRQPLVIRRRVQCDLLELPKKHKQRILSIVEQNFERTDEESEHESRQFIPEDNSPAVSSFIPVSTVSPCTVIESTPNSSESTTANSLFEDFIDTAEDSVIATTTCCVGSDDPCSTPVTIAPRQINYFPSKRPDKKNESISSGFLLGGERRRSQVTAREAAGAAAMQRSSNTSNLLLGIEKNVCIGQLSSVEAIESCKESLETNDLEVDSEFVKDLQSLFDPINVAAIEPNLFNCNVACLPDVNLIAICDDRALHGSNNLTPSPGITGAALLGTTQALHPMAHAVTLHPEIADNAINAEQNDLVCLPDENVPSISADPAFQGLNNLVGLLGKAACSTECSSFGLHPMAHADTLHPEIAANANNAEQDKLVCLPDANVPSMNADLALQGLNNLVGPLGNAACSIQCSSFGLHPVAHDVACHPTALYAAAFHRDIIANNGPQNNLVCMANVSSVDSHVNGLYRELQSHTHSVNQLPNSQVITHLSNVGIYPVASVLIPNYNAVDAFCMVADDVNIYTPMASQSSINAHRAFENMPTEMLGFNARVSGNPYAGIPTGFSTGFNSSADALTSAANAYLLSLAGANSDIMFEHSRHIASTETPNMATPNPFVHPTEPSPFIPNPFAVPNGFNPFSCQASHNDVSLLFPQYNGNSF